MSGNCIIKDFRLYWLKKALFFGPCKSSCINGYKYICRRLGSFHTHFLNEFIGTCVNYIYFYSCLFLKTFEKSLVCLIMAVSVDVKFLLLILLWSLGIAFLRIFARCKGGDC